MSPLRRGALSSAVGRVIGSRFAKPIARIALATAGLLSLAVIGRVTAAGALGRLVGRAGGEYEASRASGINGNNPGHVELNPERNSVSASPGGVR